MATRKKYYNMLDKAVEQLLISIYKPLSNNAEPNITLNNRLTWHNIQNLKKAIRNRRRPANATTNFTNNNENFTVGNKRVLLDYFNNNNNNNNNMYNTYGFTFTKTYPNGRQVNHSSMVYNNNSKPNSESVGPLMMRGSPRALAALKIQRAWRSKKAPGPFKKPEMQNILMRQIMPKLPHAKRENLAGVFRPPTRLNKELAAKKKISNKYFNVLLNNMTQKSILKGSTKMLTSAEWKKLSSHNITYNAATHKFVIPANKRQAVANTVRAMRKREETESEKRAKSKK